MNAGTPGSRIGSLFGHYRLIRLLGSGGMGEVYAAEDTVKERVVALKLLSETLTHDPGFRARLQREARAAGRLQDPHVVPIHDYGEIAGQLFVDMRLIQGPDLSAVLRQSGPLPPVRAVDIVRQAASALDAAHAIGVIHHDVKPENILLTGENFVYLVDFGIASIATEHNPAESEQVAASWKYSAPELITGTEVTAGVDVYALACVLYECLTGRPPYPGDSAKALVRAHLNAPIPRPSETVPGIPVEFDAVIAKGLAKLAADRYPSAGALAHAAWQALSTASSRPQPRPRPMPAPAPPPPHNDPDSWLRHPASLPVHRRLLLGRWHARQLGAAAAVTVAIGGIIGWLMTRPHDDQHSTTAAPATSSTPPAPTESPTDAQARLLKLLPAGYPAGACTSTAPPVDALAQLSCVNNVDPGGPPSAVYTIFSNTAALQANFKSLADTERIVVCPGRIQSPGPWHRAADPGSNTGTLLCAATKNLAAVSWTNDAARLLSVTRASSTGPSLEQLFNWWGSHS